MEKACLDLTRQLIRYSSNSFKRSCQKHSKTAYIDKSNISIGKHPCLDKAISALEEPMEEEPAAATGGDAPAAGHKKCTPDP